MVWQVAHCCLNSVAPSDGFGAGTTNWPAAIPAPSIPLQNASPIADSARRFVIRVIRFHGEC
jgi:hypothetical protein